MNVRSPGIEEVSSKSELSNGETPVYCCISFSSSSNEGRKSNAIAEDFRGC